MSKWMEIFRVGNHTSANGSTREWTDDDLGRMANAYNPGEHEAPIVIGHPKDNAPAYGWIDKLKVAGGKLLALPKQLEPQFAEMVKAGRFKKRSISVYPDGTLRHVGFLGAQPPAVKGLKDVSFGDKEEQTYEYQDMEDTMPTVEELQAQLADEKAARVAAENKADQFKEQADTALERFSEAEKKARRTEVETFIETGIKDGKVLPAWKEKGLAEFMLALDEQDGTYEFSDGKERTQGQWFREFISDFAAHPLFKTMAKPESEEQRADADYAEDEKIAREIAGVEEKA